MGMIVGLIGLLFFSFLLTGLIVRLPQMFRDFQEVRDRWDDDSFWDDDYRKEL
jgi:hypothetical protein